MVNNEEMDISKDDPIMKEVDDVLNSTVGYFLKNRKTVGVLEFFWLEIEFFWSLQSDFSATSSHGGGAWNPNPQCRPMQSEELSPMRRFLASKKFVCSDNWQEGSWIFWWIENSQFSGQLLQRLSSHGSGFASWAMQVRPLGNPTDRNRVQWWGR